MMLYHCNIGFPVVDAGAELCYPAPAGTCVSEASTSGTGSSTAPDPGYVEQCYEHDMAARRRRLRAAAVLNRAAGLGVYQRYRRDQLPHHITWRQLGSGTYVVAMEPSTNRDAGRFDARERGELIYLAPGRAAPLRAGDRCAERPAAVDGVRRQNPRAADRRGAELRAPGSRRGPALRSDHAGAIRRAVGRDPHRRPDPARRRAGRDPGPRALGPRRRHGRPLLPPAHRRPGLRAPRSPSTGVPVDAHLMVDEPLRFLPEVVQAGAAIVTVHAEASRHPHRTLPGAHGACRRAPAGDPRLRTQSRHARCRSSSRCST